MGKIEKAIEEARQSLGPKDLEEIEGLGRWLEEEYCSQIKPVTGQDDCLGVCDACSGLMSRLKRLQANVALEV